MSPVSRRSCRWPECEERAGLLPLTGRDGRTYLHCGRHHVAVERILTAAPQPAVARTRTKPVSRRRS